MMAVGMLGLLGSLAACGGGAAATTVAGQNPCHSPRPATQPHDWDIPSVFTGPGDTGLPVLQAGGPLPLDAIHAPGYSFEFFTRSFTQGGPRCSPRVPAASLRELFSTRSADVVAQLRADPAVAAALQELQTTIVEEIPELLRELIPDGRIPGLSAIVTLGSEMLFDVHAGLRTPSAPGEQAPNLDTAFQVGSVSKVLTSLGYFREVARGTLSPSDRVSSCVPGFTIRNPYSADEPTLSSLASHTSGLPREPVCGAYSWCSGAENIRMLGFQALKYAPETLSSYSNLGIGLLGHCVANVATRVPSSNRFTNQSQTSPAPPGAYDRYMVSEVLDSLNMTRSGFFGRPAGAPLPCLPDIAPSEEYPSAWADGSNDEVIEANLAHPHVLSPGLALLPVPRDMWGFGWGNAFGGLTTTPRDISRLTRFALQSGNGPMEQAEMSRVVQRWLSPAHELQDGLTSYSAGGFQQVYLNGTRVLVHGGLTAGAGAHIALVPEFGLSVSVFVALNSGSLPDSVAATSVNSLVNALRPLLSALCPHQLPDEVSNFVGRWGPGGALTIYEPDAEHDSVDGSSGCWLRASSELLGMPTPGDMIVSSAEPGQYHLRVYEMLYGEHGGDDPRWPVIWAFRYSPNRQQTDTSCYLQSAVGAEAVGYFVDQGVSGQLGLYMPDHLGATFFQHVAE